MEALRVLVVEDDALLGMLFADVLMAMGHDVCAIEATEAGAVGAAIRHRPDLMIVDAGLRDGNGVSAVDEILRTGFIPHVFVSGEISKILALKPEAIVLEKPFRDVDLKRAVQRALYGAASGC
jgi:CheY-like chemotaxis protein